MAKLGEEFPHTKEHVEKTRKAALYRESNNGHNVFINGTHYGNASIAAKALGLSPRTIIRRCNSIDINHHKYIKLFKKAIQ
jgi:hypothetical protein